MHVSHDFSTQKLKSSTVGRKGIHIEQPKKLIFQESEIPFGIMDLDPH